MVLVILCFTTFSVEFTETQYSSVQGGLTSELNLSMLEYQSIFSADSFLTVLSIVFVGLGIVKIGEARALVISSILNLVSQSLIVYSVYNKSYKYLLICKGLQGLTYNTSLATTKLVAALWFKKYQFSRVYATMSFCQKMGSMLQNMLIPYIQNNVKSVWKTLSYSIIFLVCMLMLSLIILYLNRYRNPLIHENINENITENEKNQLIEQNEQEYQKDVRNLSLKEISKLDNRYWNLVLITTLFLVQTFSFNKVSNDFYQKQYYLSYQDSGFMNSFYSIISASIALIYAYIIDKYGKRITIMTLGNILHFSGFACLIIFPFLGLTEYYAVLGCFLLANGTACVHVTVWPLYPILIKRDLLGVALGVEQMIQSLSYTINPLICGVIYQYVLPIDSTYAYPAMFAYLTVLSVPLQIMIFLLYQKQQEKIKEELIRYDQNNKVEQLGLD